MLMAVLMMVAAAGPEAERLGREIAASGTLGTILPIMKEQQIAELIAANPTLSTAEQTILRSVAEKQFATGRDRIFAAEGHQYAQTLSLTDLRAIAAYQRSPAAARMRAALPKVIARTMQAMDGMDFKGDVTKAMCAATGKLCVPAK
jgi:hypothetical protein